MIPLKRSTGIFCLVHESQKVLFPKKGISTPLLIFSAFLLSVSGVSAQENRGPDKSGFRELNSTSPATATSKEKAMAVVPDPVGPSLGDVRKLSEKAIAKASSTETFLLSRAERIIRQSQEAELKALQKMDAVSKLPAEEFARVRAFYDQMLSRVRRPISDIGFAREYLPKMDSLLTSAAFLKSFNGAESLDMLSDKLKGLQHSYFEAADIQKQINERLHSLVDRYKDKLPLKDIQKIKQLSQTARAQIQEFKNLIENPAPKVERLIDMAVQQQGFEGFFAQNAELSRLFKSPSLNIGNSAPDPGLQTVQQLEKQIQEKFGNDGKSLLAKQQQNGQQAISGIQSEMLNTILGKGAGNSGEPQINTESVKPAVKRLSFTADIRSQRSIGWLPAFSEIGVNVGYRFSPRLISGLGVSGRIGWGKGFSEFRVTMEGIGLRSFVDYKIKGGFYATGGFEAVYDPVPDLQSRINSFSQWQKNGLIGIKKGFRIKNGFIKGASMKLMWNYLSYTQRGLVQPFDFRIGYDF